jgi:hypothetical protein
MPCTRNAGIATPGEGLVDYSFRFAGDYSCINASISVMSVVGILQAPSTHT